MPFSVWPSGREPEGPHPMPPHITLVGLQQPYRTGPGHCRIETQHGNVPRPRLLRREEALDTRAHGSGAGQQRQVHLDARGGCRLIANRQSQRRRDHMRARERELIRDKETCPIALSGSASCSRNGCRHSKKAYRHPSTAKAAR